LENKIYGPTYENGYWRTKYMDKHKKMVIGEQKTQISMDWAYCKTFTRTVKSYWKTNPEEGEQRGEIV
jgi:hypothetical protein